MAKQWYVIHAYSGYEQAVREALLERIDRFHMQDLFGKIHVLTEEVTEFKGGNRRTTTRKTFPGYVFVEMEMNERSWHLVKNTPKVMVFIGGSPEQPTPLSKVEVDRLFNQIGADGSAPKPKTMFDVGEVVRITEGPFNEFDGTVEDVNYEKNLLSVSVSIFGRTTPVELEFGQVEKKLGHG